MSQSRGFEWGRSGVRRGRGDRGGRGGRGGRKICFYFQQHGTCKFGADCRYFHAHDSNAPSTLSGNTTRAEETIEEKQTRWNYNNWKTMIRRLPSADFYDMKQVWDGALAILNQDDRDRKQQLPRDLDDDSLQGRLHMRALLESKARPANYEIFIETTLSFFHVMTHTSILDCLAVDTYISGLYNFMSGSNGSRFIPFLQNLCEVTMSFRTDTDDFMRREISEKLLVLMSTILCELLRREKRARFNDDLPELVTSMEECVTIIEKNASSATITTLSNRFTEIRAIVARAHGLLSEQAKTSDESISIPNTVSSYPRNINMPKDRFDNDKADITEIIIFPTRDEIMTEFVEFLPSTDPDQPHYLASREERHIDTQFRLLRHDVFGDYKYVLANLMQAIEREGLNAFVNTKAILDNVRAYHYANSYVSYVGFTQKRGLEAQITFPQPFEVRKKTNNSRRGWWEDSKRFEEGSLLSFIWIQDSTAQHLFLTVSEKLTNPEQEYGLTNRDAIATITTKLMTQDQSTVQSLIEASRQKARGVLLEFPNVKPATFVPILENLQHMQRLSRFPFRKWILPERTNTSSQVRTHLNIPPPLYARTVGFVFSLRKLLKDQEIDLSIDPNLTGDLEELINQLEEKTQLDRGQCHALVAALTREFAFVQGPPGTGKSHLGLQILRVLLDVQKQAKLGPVVIVCYTNHALDQFLEHLIRIGIKKIIRIGGQSRSRLLEDHNLRKISQTEYKTRQENYLTARAYESLEGLEKASKSALSRIHGSLRRPEWKHIQYHLSLKHPEIHRQFDQIDEDGWIVAGRHPFDIWSSTAVSTGSVNYADEAPQITSRGLIMKATTDVDSLSSLERRGLINLWVEEISEKAVGEFYETVENAKSTQNQLTNIHDEVDRRVLEGAEVIGVTTSGLAKRISVLQHVHSKVVMCEEAGEVMEPHMISALLPSVEHFIQIGDHEQLRPTINNYNDLSLETKKGSLYQLDRSQFERLSVGQQGRPSMPVSQLNVQRRMRPDISKFIRETIYKKLVDHPTTIALPDVVGMRQNIFWLDHGNFEDAEQMQTHHNKSKSNQWEVEMVHALVRHIVRQGVYSSSDIAILTPYTGQLQKLRAAMRTDFEIVLNDRDEDALVNEGLGDATSGDDENSADRNGQKKNVLERKKLSDLLRVATVDNFQGEEAKVVIISLVRSNEKKKVGFLKTTNRINVLLSRAQHGMYIFGNTETYSNVPMWEKVIGMLRATDSVDARLGLCCPRHSETVIQVRQPDDFAHLSPEGGCREACKDRLPDCGHRCQARCHSEAMHRVWKCEQPCQRRHKPCNHPCQKQTCGEDCGRCMVMMDDVELPCGHVVDAIECHWTCNLQNFTCQVQVEKKVSRCGHWVEVSCSQDVASSHFKCTKPCDTPLPCGHLCPGTCGSCTQRNNHDEIIYGHVPCTKICGRRYGTCNHTCPRMCHEGESCGLCKYPCEVSCKHSGCKLKCHAPCAPCVEKCTWYCEHQGACTLPCSAPCNRLPCDQRCTKLLPCGHQCPGLCGEDCPHEFCHTCEMHHDEQPDMLEFKEYRDVDVNESPIVVLGCGHFFTAETLDGIVGLSDVYDLDARTGQFTKLKDNPELSPAIPKCPSCNCPIRQYVTQRYNRLINKAVIDQMTKRFIINGQTALADLENKLEQTEHHLEDSRASISPIVTNPILGRKRAIDDLNGKLRVRDDAITRLNQNIRAFQRRTADHHQPAHKLHEATLHTIKSNSGTDSCLATAFAAMNLDFAAPTERDHRITFAGRMLLIKLECLNIEDKFNVLKTIKNCHEKIISKVQLPGGMPSQLVQPFLESCVNLIADCNKESLPRVAVEATLYYARITRLYQTSGSDVDQGKTEEYTNEARVLLDAALKLCNLKFQGAKELQQAVDESIKLLRKEWYEEVTPEEVAAIKSAMVSGQWGIATHSGHWYNCANGHPFAIGECGMPMEVARCPECGARVGGQGHQAVEGVTRAINMEY